MVEESRVTYWRGLFKIIEESGELNQVLGKLAAFPKDPYPSGQDLEIHLYREIADLYAALDYFVHTNLLSISYIEKRRSEKEKTIRRVDSQWSRSVSPYEQASALFKTLPKEFKGAPIEHHPVLGGHAARMFALWHHSKNYRDKLVSDKVAQSWVSEARDALVSGGVVSLLTVQQALGERLKPKQLALF